jgi:hypothetical protein
MTGSRMPVCYETVSWIPGIGQSVIAAIIIAVACLWCRWQFGRRIKIIDPKMDGFLGAAENRLGTQAHPVSGSLSHLPKDYKVWLLVVNEQTSEIWPQGFDGGLVEYDEKHHTWKGYVHAWGWNNVTITAVIAPPTTQEYFNYVQRVGNLTKHKPILRIPPECKHRDTVRAKVPPRP